MSNVADLNAADLEALAEFLADPARPEGTLQLRELQGFLFAVCAAPEMVSPSEWLPAISDDAALDFASQGEAQQMLTTIMALYNEVNQSVLARSSALPRGCAFREAVLENFEDDAPIAQWSRGFATGHEWLAETWDAALTDELDEPMGLALMILTCFASRGFAEACCHEFSEDDAGHSLGVEAFSAMARDAFGDTLAIYATLGRSIDDANATNAFSPVSQEPARSEKVGRNAPCPCGSGKKYKQCCGATLH